MKLIDKDALVAEIWKRRNKHFDFGGSPSSEYCHEDDEILGIINTLEVKEVDFGDKDGCKNTGGFGSTWDPDSPDYCPD